ncbi:MAG: nuclear transport factor 2 family protein [Actinomycetota bacterium]|nr:nuclear transport factor 2 family protein [Actinomycetota bacterium]
MADLGSEVVRASNLGGEPPSFELGLDRLDRDGIHLEEPDATPPEEQFVDLEHVARYGGLEELIDGFVDAYNAHDLDALFDLLAEDSELPGLGMDRSGFSGAVEGFWDQRPNAVLTRGLLEDRPVAVLWDMGDGDAWSRVALFAFDSADDDSEIGLVELIDDAAAIETAETDEPEHDVPEGSRWEEWYEGADGV